MEGSNNHKPESRRGNMIMGAGRVMLTFFSASFYPPVVRITVLTILLLLLPAPIITGKPDQNRECRKIKFGKRVKS